ncbi:endonuclease/exonuclease/phosphatase family protein [Lapillicoccus jejuensis]|uniref:Endonuclease/exonuclease/phosphatase (EEP) superfamily protein YafD n=1 Tax=Lapillicoccus jejuensis TaxID=402171 RepID=A0A542E400_9MICO|nr:endonuclease/exonuclease/phosphatase family protein [Lapillicoccus jejuensis]TQJ10045.1 endonuclease/exonuclease/phosphatase (EEP) superfamily protein YafD [Lapillicoccus jejuensis]
MLRRVAGWLLALLLLGGTAGVLSRYVDLPSRLLAVVQSLVPLWCVLVVVATLAATWRHRRLAVAGLVPSVVALALLGAPYLRRTVPPGPGALTVMSANLEFGQADATQVVAAVQAHDVAVLVLLEVTPDAVRRLSAAGLDGLLPATAGSAEPGAEGSLVRSRWPLTALADGDGPAGTPSAFRQPLVRVQRPGAPFVLQAVHPLPPTAWEPQWRTSLTRLAELRRARPTDEPLVLAGDFNATDDHPLFRRVADGMSDVARDAGEGWAPTWPQDADVPPFARIDHVLVRGFSTVAAGTVHLDGTDHAAAWGTVR